MESNLHKHFSTLNDPRIDRTKRHPLINVVMIAICAVICGAENWVAIERFGKAKEEWFSTFLDLTNGIPSHDTFNRVFAAIDSISFGKCFSLWVESISHKLKDIIAIDGKAMRATKDTINGLGCLYLVNAWCTANELVIGQIEVDAKSNEITAVSLLLDLLDIKGAIITTDAMGCQKEISSKVRQKEADYVLALKGNQGNLHEAISLYLSAIEKKAIKSDFQYIKTIDGEHGRIETREYWICSDLDWLDCCEWTDLNSIAMVKSTREIQHEKSIEYRFYISSLEIDLANKLAEAIRKHWQVENCLHWCLDISFNEDRWRSKLGDAAANIGILNKIALNLLKNEKTAKVGIKNKRLMAGWDEKYLLKVLKSC